MQIRGAIDAIRVMASWVVVFQCRWTCNHGDGDVMLGVALLIPLPFSCTLAGGCDDLCCSCVVISDAKISRGLGLLIW
jgi:hypothetical protein